MVVPTYDVVNLADGANQWVQILKHLVKGESVLSAVNNANGTTGLNWRVLGNPNVTISSAK